VRDAILSLAINKDASNLQHHRLSNQLTRFTQSNPLAAALLIACSVSQHSASEVAKDGAEVGKRTMDYDAAAKLPAERGLPMLLNFTGSDWCGR